MKENQAFGVNSMRIAVIAGQRVFCFCSVSCIVLRTEVGDFFFFFLHVKGPIV